MRRSSRAAFAAGSRRRDVVPGEEYVAALVNALRESRLMVLVFSSGANQSKHVLREVERALSMGLPVVPLRIENVRPSAAMEYYIASRPRRRRPKGGARRKQANRRDQERRSAWRLA